MIEKGKEQITKKGEEILKFKDEHNIKIQGMASASSEAGPEDKGTENAGGSRNVLVVNN